jgi:hypothetical protein
VHRRQVVEQAAPRRLRQHDKPGQLGGGVGSNGGFVSSQTNDIWGTLWSASPSGVSLSNTTNVHYELRSGGPPTTNTCSVAKDAYVNGNAKGRAPTIGGALHLPTAATITGNVTEASTVRGPVSVPPPCRCDPSEILPIASWVAAAKLSNDNGTSLDPALFTKASQPSRLDLPCGRFYLDAIQANGPLTIAAHGRTALFIGGDVTRARSVMVLVPPSTVRRCRDGRNEGGAVVASSLAEIGVLQVEVDRIGVDPVNDVRG